MAKGFGEKRSQEIGFALVVIPEANAYAARTDLDYLRGDEPFFGVTSILEDARIWKTKKQIQKAVPKYIPLLLEDTEGDVDEIELQICSVFKDKKGILRYKIVNSIYLQSIPEDTIVEK